LLVWSSFDTIYGALFVNSEADAVSRSAPLHVEILRPRPTTSITGDTARVTESAVPADPRLPSNSGPLLTQNASWWLWT